MNCDDERLHERDGREAFRHRDWHAYGEACRDRHDDDCKAAFARGYERAERQRRDDLRREEEEHERLLRVEREREEYDQYAREACGEAYDGPEVPF